ncbi:MAG: ATP synthase F1 subunit delta [Candidatus Parcubacteria bacterium]|nr:ATP synthase F1 subunit delta [Candidatus Parcubacteria bacterium]
MRKISIKKYAQVLYEITKDLPKEQIKVEIDNFLKLVVRNKDSKQLNKISLAFDDYAKKQESIVDVQVVSAEALSPGQKEDLKNHIKKEQKVKTVNLDEKTDKSLLGGFVLRIGNTIFDASLKTRLEELRTEMKKS